MINEQDAVEEILKHFHALKEAADDAQHWYNHYKTTVQSNYDQQVAHVQEENAHRIQEARAKFAQEHQVVCSTIEQAIASLGILSAPWSSQLWKPSVPALHNGAEGIESPISAYADANKVPSGIRIGEMLQPDLDQPLPSVPAMIPLIGHGHIIIMSRGAEKAKALSLLQSIITRIVLTFPVLSTRFVYIDPLGLGDSFPFKLLPETIRGDTIYSEADEIRDQLRELTEHLRKVTLKYLAREYDNIEAYNQDADEVVEPYRFLCIADFPLKIDSDAAIRLMSIAERGIRTGIYILMHINLDAEMPRSFDIEALKRTATVITVEQDKCSFPIDNRPYLFVPDSVPQSDLFNTLMKRVNAQAKHGTFRVIPFHKVAQSRKDWWNGNSAALIDVPIGCIGARDTLHFWLGKKEGRVSSHALVGGKTGSGKSMLFHVLINSLATTYSPAELEIFLIDFKEGIEFKSYADFHLPHARVIAIESEREFGLSVLRNLHAELERRRMLFKEVNAQDLLEYRERSNKKLPRIILIIDEFQILFAEQDVLSGKAALFLDDLVRHGLAFGIHIIMGSQSFKLAHLPNSIYSQFATRIVLQSPQQEVAMLLGSGNVAVSELLDRHGEVIYNDDWGRRDRNEIGQVAALSKEDIELILRQLNELAQASPGKPWIQIVFRSQEASNPNDNQQLKQLYDLPDWPTPDQVKELLDLRDWKEEEKPALAWMGEAIEIKPPASVRFQRRSRANLLIVGNNEEDVFGMLGVACISLAAFYRPGDMQFRIINASSPEEEWEDTCDDFKDHFTFHDIVVRQRRGAAELIDAVAGIVQQRLEGYSSSEGAPVPSVFLVVAGAHRLSELRPKPGRFGHNEPSDHINKLMDILQRGPELGVYTILWYDSTKSFDNTMSRSALAYFDRRIAFSMSKDDSQYLLNDPIAHSLQRFRAVILDDEQNAALEKFKPYTLPARKSDRAQQIRRYADLLRSRIEGDR